MPRRSAPSRTPSTTSRSTRTSSAPAPRSHGAGSGACRAPRAPIQRPDACSAQALIHSSYLHEQPSAGQSNERLEFLGDSVIGLIISEALWRRYPSDDEGSLTTRRAAIVSARGLSRIAQRLELGRLPVSRPGRGRGRRAAAQVGARGPVRGRRRAPIYLEFGLAADARMAARRRTSRSCPSRTRSTRSSRPRACSRSSRTRARAARRTTGWSATKVRRTRASTSSRRSSVARRWARASGRSRREAETEAAREAIIALERTTTD